MTKHRASFAEVTEPTPDTQDLVSFIRRTGFMVATQRTKPLLDVLAKAGVLKRRKQGRMWRYTLKGKEYENV